MNEALRSTDGGVKQDDDEDGLMEMTDFYDPIAALLSSIGGEAENLTEELRKYEIKYEHLSGLCEEDLIILGLKNRKVREEVLAEIELLPNQIEHYDQALRSINIHEYIREVLTNNQKHLERLYALFSLTKLKISAHHVENLQIEETQYASDIAVSVCKKLSTKCCEIEQLLKNLRQGSFFPKQSSSDRELQKMGCLNKCLLFSVMLSCVYLGVKMFKQFAK